MEMLVNDNLKIYMEELNLVKEAIKKLESEKNDIMYMISKEMANNEILMDEGGVVIATYKKCFRTTFDSRALEEKMPEVYKKFLKQSECRTFLVK